MPRYAVNVALFTAYVAASSIGLLVIKQSLGRMRAAGGAMLTWSPQLMWLGVGFVLYVVSFAVWIRILARLPLSTAYPIAIGLTLAFSTSGAVLLLGERLGAVKLVGIMLIFAGCVALSLDNK